MATILLPHRAANERQNHKTLALRDIETCAFEWDAHPLSVYRAVIDRQPHGYFQRAFLLRIDGVPAGWTPHSFSDLLFDEVEEANQLGHTVVVDIENIERGRRPPLLVTYPSRALRFLEEALFDLRHLATLDE